MRRVLVLAPALLFAVSTHAQDVSASIAKDFWCGVAIDMAVRDVPADAAPEVLTITDPYKAGAETLIARAKIAHLEAGYTEEAFDQLRADTETTIAAQLSRTDPAIAPAYSFEDCAALIGL